MSPLSTAAAADAVGVAVFSAVDFVAFASVVVVAAAVVASVAVTAVVAETAAVVAAAAVTAETLLVSTLTRRASNHCHVAQNPRFCLAASSRRRSRDCLLFH